MFGNVVMKPKLPSGGVSIFAVITRLANEHGAINLGQGFPDYNCAPELIDAVSRYMREGHNQYAPMPGVLALREALAMKIERLYGRRYDPVTEITVTTGATEGIFNALTALVHPGDEVLLFQPAYDSYTPSVVLSGGIPRYVTLRFPDYRIDWDEVRQKVSGRTRAIVINTPHNPTGMAWTADDVAELRRVLQATDAVVIRTHHVRRHPPRKPGALLRYRRTRDRHQLVRQDLPHDRMEGRLLRGAAGTHEGDPGDSPVGHVCREWRGADGVRRHGHTRSGGHRGDRVLSGPPGPLPVADSRLPLPAACVPGHVLSARRLLGNHGRAGH
jgi:hypothetical protein